ncbi:adenosylcobalamin-dependent ribonucleoside-diphosphate reductase, partial [Aduncisulcus paluster]
MTEHSVITRESAKMALEEHTRFQETVSSKNIKSAIAKDVCELLQSGRFIPAGSILSGLGNEHAKCSLSNCYLAKIESDSLE